MTEDITTLFEVEDKPITQDSIHVIAAGPSLMRMMAIKYDPTTYESTWVSPGVTHPLQIVFNSRLLSHQQHPDSGKSCIVFAGVEVRAGDIPYESLTPEQQRIHDNWEAEAEKAGCGGSSFPR